MATPGPGAPWVTRQRSHVRDQSASVGGILSRLLRGPCRCRCARAPAGTARSPVWCPLGGRGEGPAGQGALLTPRRSSPAAGGPVRPADPAEPRGQQGKRGLTAAQVLSAARAWRAPRCHGDSPSSGSLRPFGVNLRRDRVGNARVKLPCPVGEAAGGGGLCPSGSPAPRRPCPRRAGVRSPQMESGSGCVFM